MKELPKGLARMETMYKNEQYCEAEGRIINCQCDCLECFMEHTGKNQRIREKQESYHEEQS